MRVLIVLLASLVTPLGALAQGHAQSDSVKVEAVITGPLASVPLSWSSYGVSSPAFSNSTAVFNRIRGVKVVEGAVLGFTLGALIGGVATVLGDESGNVALNMFVFAVPGAVLGALIATSIEVTRPD